MKRKLVLASAALLMMAWSALAGCMIWFALEATAREPLRAAFESMAAMLFAAWVMLSLLAGWGLSRLWQRAELEPRRFGAAAQALIGARSGTALSGSFAAPLQAAAHAVTALVAQRDDAIDNTEARVRQASAQIDQERERLAALMAEIHLAVVVCDLDGRVLMYNNRARLQFRSMSERGALMDGAELLGLGRSIYAVLDSRLIAHALQDLQLRLRRGAQNPSAQFITGSRSGQLIRVQVTAVPRSESLAPSTAPSTASPHHPDEDPEGPRTQGGGRRRGPRLNGFVLTLDNVTRHVQELGEHQQHMRALLQTAHKLVDSMRHGARDEGAARHASLTAFESQLLAHEEFLDRNAGARWPLEDMLGSDFVVAARRRLLQNTPMRVRIAEVDESIWLRIDSWSMIQALQMLAARLAEDFDIRNGALRLRDDAASDDEDAPRAHLDLCWQGPALSQETVQMWQADPAVADVVERHGGSFGFGRETARQTCHFRFGLPQASARERLEAATLTTASSRPEFHDFDLFAAIDRDGALHERTLSSLSYTVFDTETTGLDPSAGDEIIQIGATRIVQGRLLRHESFEQLVDPQRSIPPAGIPIHGISPDMVAHQPTIDRVLPTFHAYAADTVLVAHNAAFDMRFLELKEPRTGLRFDQPVLDTLLLSALLSPEESSHRLEAIAERLGVTVLGRHTALGDALVTAEVFLRMLPMLEARGIRTLGEAIDESRRTWHAGLKY